MPPEGPPPQPSNPAVREPALQEPTVHSAQLYDEVETLLGEEGPSTEAFQSLTYAQRIAVLMLSRGAKHTDVALELDRSVRTLNTGWSARTSARPSTRPPALS